MSNFYIWVIIVFLTFVSFSTSLINTPCMIVASVALLVVWLDDWKEGE